ncbi:MAG: tetratricopeptide repeat protein, partial [Flavobacteriales bacterium]|nr:tetratricopeptide repeat protein [Flavobacteriales bacterium]
MKKLLFICFLMWSVFVFGQEPADQSYYLVKGIDLGKIEAQELENLEAALKIYHTAQEDTAKIAGLVHFVENSWDDKLWPKYNRWVYQFAKDKSAQYQQGKHKVFWDKTLSQSLNNIGFSYLMEGRLEKALAAFQESLNYCKGDELAMAGIYNNIAGVYESSSNLDDALLYYNKSVELQKKNNDLSILGSTLCNIAAIHYDLGDIDIAINIYLDAINYDLKLGNTHGLSVSYNNLGLLYDHLEEYDEALIYFRKSIKLLEESNSDRKGVATAMHNIGDIYAAQNVLDTAMIYYHEALATFEEIEYKQGISNAKRSIGEVFLKQGQTDQALVYLEKAHQIAQELGYTATIESSALALSHAYEKKKSFKKALELYKFHVQMSDSVNSETNQKAAAKQEAKYEYEKQKALDDAEHEKQLAIEQEAKQKQQILTFATAGGLGLVG